MWRDPPACRVRSEAEFISTTAIAKEEADESTFWLELIEETGLTKKETLCSVVVEANELTAMFTAAGKNMKGPR